MTIDACIHDAGFDDACILDYPGSWSRIHGACVCIYDRDIDQQQDKRVLGVYLTGVIKLQTKAQIPDSYVFPFRTFQAFHPIQNKTFGTFIPVLHFPH